jgi:RNA polymerase sigma factor (sigma-70 family)
VASHKNTEDSPHSGLQTGLQSGSAVDTAFEQYRPELRRFLRTRAHSSQNADDLAQEVYLRILRFPPREVIRQPQAYLYRIASNVVHDYNLRLQQEQISFDSDTLDTLSEHPLELSADELPDQLSAEQELQRVLARLPKAWQAALVLRKRDGLSYPDIARRLGVSVHAVKKYIARAVAYSRTRERGASSKIKS